MVAGLEHIRWDGHGPVEDPRHPAGEEDAGDTELVVTVGRQRTTTTMGGVTTQASTLTSIY